MFFNDYFCCPFCKTSLQSAKLSCSTCKTVFETKNNQAYLLKKELYDFSIPTTDPLDLRKRYEINLFNSPIESYIESIQLLNDQESPIFVKEKLWAEKIAQTVRPHHRILDIGGGMSRKLASHHDLSKNTIIVDFAANEINRGSHTFQKVIADCEALPFCSHTFDFVFVDAVLHHVPQQKLALEEIKRVLKTDGRAFIVEPAKYSVAMIYFLIKKIVYFFGGNKGLKIIGYHGSKYESFLSPHLVKKVFKKQHVHIEKSSPIRLPFIHGLQNSKIYTQISRLAEKSFLNRLFGSYVFIQAQKKD